MRLLSKLLGMGALMGAMSAALADDFATWNGVSLKILDTEHVDLVTLGQVRLYNNSSELLQYALSQQVVVDLNRFLRTGVNYTFLPTRGSEGDDFIDQHRVELEFTPRWPINDRLTLDLRNRLEIRWIEGFSGTNERVRNRLGVSYELRNTGLLHSIFATEEIFYPLADAELTQNRLTPIGLRFRLNEHVGFSTYYMLQSIKRAGDWNNAHVIGTQFLFSF